MRLKVFFKIEPVSRDIIFVRKAILNDKTSSQKKISKSAWNMADKIQYLNCKHRILRESCLKFETSENIWTLLVNVAYC